MLMKKSLIALAVAGALTAPMVAQADATLYGSMRVLVVDEDTQDLDVADGTSRIGIKGDVDLGIDGVKGIYNFETRLRADNGTFAGDNTTTNNARLSNIGITGDFGTALAGKQYAPHWLWTSAVTDATWNDAIIGTIRESILRPNSTLAYISPNMSGFQAALAVVADSGLNAGEDVDYTNIAVKYAANGLHLALSHVDDGGANSQDQLGVAASYTMDAFKFSARYQEEDNTNGNAGALAGTDTETTQVGVAYTMGATTLQARFTNIDIDNGADADQWAVGVQQMLGSQGRVFLEYADVGSNGFNGAVTSDVDRLSIGYRLDF
jgi:predicted porin